MKKNFLIVIVLLLLSGNVLKAAVYVDSTIVASDGKHKIRYSLPNDYSKDKIYPMLLCLQPCNGSTYKEFIAAFKLITDSLDMIIACPDMGASGGWFSVSNHDIVTASIDSALQAFNIDEKQVYFTGMSCNGEIALRLGSKKLYPFKGIFPFAPYGTYYKTVNLNTDVPVTIAVGTFEEMAYTQILNIFDSLKSHGAKVNLVLIPGVGHTYAFSSFAEEMLRSIMYLNDTDVISLKYSEANLPNYQLMDTDGEKELTFNTSSKGSKDLIISAISSNLAVIANPSITYTAADGTVKLKFKPIAGKAGNVVIVLEAKEKGGTAIEQVTFNVKVAKVATTNVSNSQQFSTFEVYPIPASDKLFFKTEAQKLAIQISDINGRIVLKSTYYNNGSVDISNLNPGLYFITATGSDNYKTVKFLVK